MEKENRELSSRNGNRKLLAILKNRGFYLQKCELGRQCGSFCLKSLNLVFQLRYIPHLTFLRSGSRLTVCQDPEVNSLLEIKNQ